MNFIEQAKLFERAENLKHNYPENYSLTSMLKLPIKEPSYVINDILYEFKKMADKNIVSLLNIIPKIDKNEFNEVTDLYNTSDYHNHTKATTSNVLNYIENIYNQFKNIANEYGIVFPKSIELEKNNILQEVEDFTNKFEQFSDFFEKYKVIEKFYVQNKMSPEADFYREELQNTIKEYSHIVNINMAKFFINNTVSHGQNSKDIVLFQLFDRLSILISTMQDEMKSQNLQSLATMASQFIIAQSIDSSNVKSFLTTKSFSDDIDCRIQLTSSQKISEMINFKDGSTIIKQRNNPYEEVSVDKVRNVTYDLFDSIIDYKFRKKPRIGTLFKEKYKEERGLLFEYVDVAMNTYLDNEAILKNVKFDLSIFKSKDFEEIDDAMNASINTYKIDRYANTILSTKYKHLLTANALESFKELYEAKISTTDLQNLIGKKLAAIQSPEEFEQYLDKVVKQFNGFNTETLLTKLSSFNIEPLLSDNDVYVFEIKNFEESKNLGSASWCIARSEHYFENYTDYGNRQFFIYDFNKKETSNESMIGITIKQNGDFHTQHLKNDDFIRANDFLKDIRKRLILKEPEKYELNNQLKQELGIDNNNDFNDENKKKLKVVI